MSILSMSQAALSPVRVPDGERMEVIKVGEAVSFGKGVPRSATSAPRVDAK
jgi:hypothetical protein